MRIIRSEIYFPIIIAIHFIFWAIDLSFYTGNYKFTTQHVAGEIFSSWVVTVFAANFLMATRAKWIERIFGGLDKMFLVHRRSGIIAIVLILLHFIIIPKTAVFQIGKPMGFIALILILTGVILTVAKPFKRRIPYHRWKVAHLFMGLFYLIGLAHAAFVPNLTRELPMVRSYVFGMAMIGVLAWLYKAFLYNIFNRKLIYAVEKITQYKHDLMEITLNPVNKHLLFKAGQFIFISFKGFNRSEAHPFTISSHPADKNFRLSIKASGDYTSDLQTALTEKTIAKVQGPFGLFDFKSAKHKNQIWLAGGIGITPYLSFLHEVNVNYNITLIWCVKTKEDAPYEEEINQIASNNTHIDFRLHDTSKQGYFTIEQGFDSRDLKQRSIFICGPEAMRESYIDQLMKKGISIKDIHYEEFSFR